MNNIEVKYYYYIPDINFIGSVIDEAGTIVYYLNRRFHRVDGPAVEYADGHKEWYLNGKCHRENGPAIEWSNGDKYWFLNGKRHRIDGPACEFAAIEDAVSDEWWYYGEFISEDQNYTLEDFQREIKLRLFK